MTAPHHCSAYSLFELLMTLAIAAIVLTIGLPSFARLVADHRLRVESDALFHAVHLARKESIARRRVVTLCSSLDGQTCAGDKDWSSGWILFVNQGRSNETVRDPNEELLTYHPVAVEARLTANRLAFSLRSTDLRATNGTLIICDRGEQATARALIISYTGRPRVSLYQASGQAWKCAD